MEPIQLSLRHAISIARYMYDMVATRVLVSAFHVRHDLFNGNFVIGTPSGIPEARQQVKVVVDTTIDFLVRYMLIPISADMFAEHRLGRKE